MANEKTTDVWQFRKVYFDINGEPAAYAKIPESHRVVIVEMLDEVERILTYRLHIEAALKLRAIIDNRGGHE